MIRFPCAKCGKVLKAPPDKTGALARCPGCGHKTPIPAANAGAAPIPDDDEPNVELVETELPEQPAEPKLARRTEPKPTRSKARRSPLGRAAKLVIAVVAIAVVLLAGMWAGMAVKAGGVAGAPHSWDEFWTRLRQQAVQEK
jgi:uncharacterized Zn finger protein (UPF0148 family)